MAEERTTFLSVEVVDEGGEIRRDIGTPAPAPEGRIELELAGGVRTGGRPPIAGGGGL
jgi:hypothetical protein